MIDEKSVDQLNTKRKLDEVTPATNQSISTLTEKRALEQENDKKEEQSLIDTSTFQLKKKLCLHKFKNLNSIRNQCMGNMTEKFYLENGFNYLNFNKFLLSANGCAVPNDNEEIVDTNDQVTEKTNQELRDYISKKFPDRLKQYDLESKLADKFGMSLPLLQLKRNDIMRNDQEEINKSIKQPLTPHSQLNLLIEKQQQNSKTIAERAKNEAQILQRITQLRKEGLWSIKRLPKLVEPQRIKTHWDFLLDEMVWMSTDFQQERKWKKNASKKLSTAIQKYFKEKEAKAEQQEKEETKRMRKQAGQIAKDIMQFWRNVEKIIEYKQKSLIEEKRKQAMDLHLNFIVDQTEKYSSWLIESLATNQQNAEQATKTVSDTTPNTSVEMDDDKDVEFDKLNDESDDESTIEKEELIERNKEEDSMPKEETDELKQLQMENEQSLEELLREYNLDESYFKSDVLANKPKSDPSRSDRLQKRQQQQTKMEVDNDDEKKSETSEKSEDNTQVERIKDDEDSLGTTDLSETDSDASEEESSQIEDEESDLKYLDTSMNDEKNEKTIPDVAKIESNVSSEKATEPQDDKVLNTIAATAQSLQPTGYTLETTTVKTQIPTVLLKNTLREYQHVGLDWLVTMNENRLNGILADEMGLGKTIQTIALLAYLACEKGNWGPHLIVVPTSVMLNWELEFKRWCPGFKILTYYGNPKERKLKRQGWTKVNAFHVCITSYKLVIQDHAAFRRKKWKYFILDEAQNIKNFKSQRWQGLLNFQSQRRLLLTGTPLQNNLMELWSLMHFLMPHVFSSHREFQHWFSNPLKCMIEGNQEYNEDLIRRLHKVLRPFILRRLKIDVEKQMPKKYEHVIRCKLSKRQRLLYNEFMSLASTKKKLAEGHYMSVINILMQLRKVCNHPDLFEPRPIVSSFVTESITYSVPSNVFNLSGEVFSEKLDSIFFYHPNFPEMEYDQSIFHCHRAKNLQVSKRIIEEIMNWDQLENTEYTKSMDQRKFFEDDTFHGVSMKDNEEIQSKLQEECLIRTKPLLKSTQTVSQRLKYKTQYLIRTNRHHCNFYKPVYGIDLQEFVGNKEMLLKPLKTKRFGTYNSMSYSTCAQTVSYEDNKYKSETFWSQTESLSEMLNIVQNGLYNEKKNHELSDVLSRFIMYVPSVVTPTKSSFDSYSNGSIRLSVAHPHPSLYQRQKILIEDITMKASSIKQTETSLVKNQLINQIDCSMRTQFPEKRLIKYDCGKLQTLADLLRSLIVDQHRVLLFTQMTRMLDILENFLNYHGYKYLRLDGSTSIEQRQVLMERFNNDKKIFAFILSTRSGGIGVNLTGADTVIFYDSDWNPTMDAQAQDRCHRIGQTRDVHIYRLISEKTVEENILKKANQKRLLADMTIEGGCFTTALLKKHHISELFNEEDPLAIEAESGRVINSTSSLSITENSGTMGVIEKQASSIAASEEAAKEKVDETKMEETNESSMMQTPDKTDESASNSKAISKDIKESQFEDALALVEDESDVLAAKELKAEVRADISEFSDEAIAGDGQEVENTNEIEIKHRQSNDMNKLQNEFKLIETELKPIERYALKFLESNGENLLVLTEEKEIEIEQVKKDWELNRLKQLKEEEERKAEEQEEDEMMYTYTKTEVRKPKNSINKKPLRSLKKTSQLKRSSLTSKTNTYLSERPKRTITAASAIQKTSKLLKKAVLSLSPVKKVAVTTSISDQKQRSMLYKKSISTGNLIENELIKYRKQNEKLEIEAQKQAQKTLKAQQRKRMSKLNESTTPDISDTSLNSGKGEKKSKSPNAGKSSDEKTPSGASTSNPSTPITINSKFIRHLIGERLLKENAAKVSEVKSGEAENIPKSEETKIDDKNTSPAGQIKVKRAYNGKKRGRKCKSLNPPLTIAEYEAAKLSGQLSNFQQAADQRINMKTDQRAKLNINSKKLHTLILNRSNEQAVKKSPQSSPIKALLNPSLIIRSKSPPANTSLYMTSNFSLANTTPPNQITKLISTGETARVLNMNSSTYLANPVYRTIIRPVGTPAMSQISNQNITSIKTISNPSMIRAPIQNKTGTLLMTQNNVASVVPSTSSSSSMLSAGSQPPILSLVNKNNPKPIIVTKRVNPSAVTTLNQNLNIPPATTTAIMNSQTGIGVVGQSKSPITSITNPTTTPPNTSQKIIYRTINSASPTAKWSSNQNCSLKINQIITPTKTSTSQSSSNPPASNISTVAASVAAKVAAETSHTLISSFLKQQQTQQTQSTQQKPSIINNKKVTTIINNNIYQNSTNNYLINTNNNFTIINNSSSNSSPSPKPDFKSSSETSPAKETDLANFDMLNANVLKQAKNISSLMNMNNFSKFDS